MYIQVMGTQMRFFVEEILRFEDKTELSTIDMHEGLNHYAKKAFWRFTYFHETILPIGFYANCIQVKTIAHVCIELLKFIDYQFFEIVSEDVVRFINSQVLVLFCKFEGK